MPNYGVYQASGNPPSAMLTGLQPGDGPYFLFNAETPTAPQASVAFERATGSTSDAICGTFTVSWAGAPSAAAVAIQGANVDQDGAYQTLNTVSAFPGSYTDTNKFNFYRAKLISNSGGTGLTVTVQR